MNPKPPKTYTVNKNYSVDTRTVSNSSNNTRRRQIRLCLYRPPAYRKTVTVFSEDGRKPASFQFLAIIKQLKDAILESKLKDTDIVVLVYPKD